MKERFLTFVRNDGREEGKKEGGDFSRMFGMTGAAAHLIAGR